MDHRLSRAKARLRLLQDLQEVALLEVQRLERQLHPPQVIQLEPEPEPPPPVDLRVLTPGRPQQEIPFEVLMEAAQQPEEPMPDPRLEIAQRLGLPPQPS